MVFFEDAIARDSSFGLDDAIGWAADDFVEGFEERWGLDASKPPEGVEVDEWLRARKLRGLAQSIARVAATLMREKGLGRDRLSTPRELQERAGERQLEIERILKLIEEKLGKDATWQFRSALLPTELDDPRTEANIFQNMLQLEAASLFPHNLSAIAKRMYGLTDYLFRNRGERSAAYLGRLARCYILDMRTEFTVMARAVLDAGLQEVVDDSDVPATVGAARWVGLERRIAYLESRGVFDAAAGRAARDIKVAGDDAVHNTPGLEPAFDDTLDRLRIVFDALERVP